MNGISPLSSSQSKSICGSLPSSGDSGHDSVTAVKAAGVGIKRPSLEESIEAPGLKKSAADLDLGSLLQQGIGGCNMTETTLAETEGDEVFVTPSSATTISYYSALAMSGAGVSASCESQPSIQTVSEQVLVPDGMVGLIIGRGGEQITRLQAESRCKIQMAQDGQGQQHRVCTLTGSTEAIALAKELIDKVISNEHDKAAMRGNQPQDISSGGFHEMMVPGAMVARIIGRGGEVIKALQEETGARIVIIQDSREFAVEKPLRITGSAEVVELARMRVEDILAAETEKMALSSKKPWHQSPDSVVNNNTCVQSCYDAGEVTEVISIPSTKVGLVMGRGGETIRHICLHSGAHCQVDKNAPDGAREKNIVIKGRPGNVQKAKAMVSEKVGDWNLQYSTNQIGSEPRAGQQDYSQQWAEYYRSLGMLKEAEIIEQQMMLSRGGGLASGRGVGGVAQPDYSAQWAEYYRSLGKFKEAEAIEAQMKMKDLEVCRMGIYSP